MNFCQSCGNKLNPGDAFCTMCGSRISPAPVAAPATQPEAPVAPQVVPPVIPQYEAPVVPQYEAPVAPKVVPVVEAPVAPQAEVVAEPVVEEVAEEVAEPVVKEVIEPAVEEAAEPQFQAPITAQTTTGLNFDFNTNTATPATTEFYEYKVLSQKDKWFSGKFDPILLEQALNAYAQQGWRVIDCATADIPGFGGPRQEFITVLERKK